MGRAVSKNRVLGTSKETEKEWSERSKKHRREQHKANRKFYKRITNKVKDEVPVRRDLKTISWIWHWKWLVLG